MTAIRSWLLLIPALVLPGAFAWCYFIGAGGGSEAHGWYASAKGFLLIWPFLCRAVFLRGESAPAWRQPRKGLSMLAGLLAGGLVVLLMFALWGTPVGSALRESAEPIRAKLSQFGVGRHNYLLVALGFSLVHSALEEYYWRWFVFGELRRLLGVGWTPHAVAAAGFSLHHYVALGVYFGPGPAAWMGTLVGVGGLLWSGMYERWGTLAGPWLSHVIIDLAMFGFAGQLLNFGI